MVSAVHDETIFRRCGAGSLSTTGRVATSGMFIIDHFQVKNESGDETMLDEEAIGGGGIFAMVSARMFLPAKYCALIVDQGSDFPPRFVGELQMFGAEMTWFRHREGKTTRALNIYSGSRIGEGHQSFRYLSPQLNLTPKDILLPPSPFALSPPEWIHVVCVTERARDIAEELHAIQAERTTHANGHSRLVWEPLGRCCNVGNLDAILDVVKSYAAFSPNSLEMQAILGQIEDESVQAVEQAAKSFARLVRERCSSCDGGPAIIVRAGALGSYTVSDTWSGWVPAYWSAAEQDKVVDVTGGGNSYLGGLCAGLLLTNGDWRAASIYASTAASFAIQQKGLPRLTRQHEQELWNGEDPWNRLRDMANRVAELERRP